MTRSSFRSALLTLSLSLFVVACGPQEQTEATDQAATVTRTDLVSLRAYNGAFVCADLSDHGELTNALIANRDKVGEWETFEVKDLGNGRIALKAANGKFVSSDRERGNMLLATRDTVGEWETFEVLTLGEDVKVLRASDGMYVCADLEAPGDKAGLLSATRTEAKEWESFKIEPVTTVAP